jgi:2-oxo-4-hydroxy-4-carboxy-5-ureidoimidazoline decarboxylase
MSKMLERINQAAEAEAGSMFRNCCGSAVWAARMVASRPFVSESELLETAAAIWKDLDQSDWLEAFAAHPMIGETKSAPGQQVLSAKWSAGEQSGMSSADELLKQELAGANRAYYEKFGFIFIVCATGKTPAEMLELCRTRFSNNREREVCIAADEQMKITEIRLRKLVS